MGMRVLITNDSPLLAAVIKAIVETHSGYDVVGVAANGWEAVAKLATFRPDIVLMDIHMPVMGGVEATRHIMSVRPKTRILITTTSVTRNMKYILEALQYGAIDYVSSPSIPYAPGAAVPAHQLRSSGTKLLAKMVAIACISNEEIAHHQYKPPESTQETLKKHPAKTTSMGFKSLLAIGCSTGGPATVAILLSSLHKPFPIPIVVIQHLDAAFTSIFVSWLAEQTDLSVHLAKDNVQPQPGKVYVVPGGEVNAELTCSGRFKLTTPLEGQFVFPNIDHMFFSMAKHLGNQSYAAVLTGMGEDGALGIAEIHKQGGGCLIQDLESSVIDSMPRASRRHMATDIGYTPKQMAMKFNEWVLVGDY
jgi:chemotaxis response regulator CheB